MTIKNVDDTPVTITTEDNEFVFDGTFHDASGKTTVTLPTTYDSKVTLDSMTSNLDATKRTSATKITGNDLDNSIVGGKGSDTLDGGTGNDSLTGGAGSDVFIYSGGKDVITDYGTGSDKISIASDYTLETSVVSGSDIIYDFGDGNSLTIKDFTGNVTMASASTAASVGTKDKFNSSKKTSVRLGTATTAFDAKEYPNLVTINGSLVEGTVSIVGNDKANLIYAGNNGSTLNGGAGADKLYGGDGADTFVYEHLKQEKTTYTANGAVVSTIYSSGADVIYNYGAGDKISLGADVVLKNAYQKNSDTIIKVDDSRITVKDSANKSITLVQDGEEITFNDGVFNKPDTSILPSTYDSEVTLGPTTKNLDASKRTSKTKLTGNALDNSIVGGTSSDTLDGGKGNDSLTGGAGSDVFVYTSGNDVITDYGNGKDKISTASDYTSYTINGGDITFNFADGSLKLKDAADKEITINGVTSKYAADGIINSKGTAITLKSDATTYTADTDIVTIDGSQTKNAVLVGNTKSNQFYGGTGSTFVYNGGKDIVYNYANGDKISLGAESVLKDFYTKNNDVILRVDSGSIVVKNSADKSITLSQGDKTYTYSQGEMTISETIILPATFDNEYTLSDKTNVDASRRTAAIKLTGNSGDNELIGGKKNDTLYGGEGNDVLTGGAGADVFIYSGGKDTINDYGNGTDKISVDSALAFEDFEDYAIEGTDLILIHDLYNQLTVKNGANKAISINGVSKIYSDKGIFNSKGTAISLASIVESYKADDTIVTIDGSQTDGVTVIGNVKSNRFYGGKGADIFVYEHVKKEKTTYKAGADGAVTEVVSTIYSSGSDVIYNYNYAEGDKISLGSDVKLNNGYMKNEDFIAKVDNGYITVKNNSEVTFVQGGKDFDFNGSLFIQK